MEIEKTVVMEKRYKLHLTKNDRVVFALLFIFIIASIIWIFSKKEYFLLINLLIPSGFFLFFPNRYRLTSDDMLDVRHLFGIAFKPISVNQIICVTQKSKNEVILVYNRNGLRGDRILRLSETDMKDFLSELQMRNPALELSTKMVN